MYSYKLGFDKSNGILGVTPRYDGNVSSMEWVSGGKTKASKYTYDNVNQLSEANYLQKNGATWNNLTSYAEKDITYDLNGNIKTQKRTNSTGGNLHNIALTVDGNKVVRANVNNVNYNYTFDVGGNLITDGYRVISISYNILNLPEKIFAGSDG